MTHVLGDTIYNIVSVVLCNEGNTHQSPNMVRWVRKAFDRLSFFPVVLHFIRIHLLLRTSMYTRTIPNITVYVSM